MSPCSSGVADSEACSAAIEAKFRRGITPLQDLDAVEAVPLDRLHQFGLERVATPSGAESAVPDMPAGTAGDLPKFRWRQAPKLITVEFPVAREGNMVDIEVEAHADGIGGDQEADIAILVHRDLGVARARRQRAENHGSAAALAADQFGDGIDLVGREGDDSAAPWQTGELAVPREEKVRQSRARDDVHTGYEPFNDRLHRRRAEQQRLSRAAPIQQPVCEDMASLEIGGDLDLVECHKRHVEVALGIASAVATQ